MEKSPRVAAVLRALALAGASGCVATFDYPIGDLSDPQDAAAETAADARADASDSGVDVSVDGDATADASVEADADAGVNTAGLGVLGGACGQPGDLACAGHAKKITLLCDGTGHWAASVTCPNGELCDSRAGLNRGTCAAIDPVCSASQPGDIVCDGQRRTQCGPDLVSSIVLETCVSQACTPAACVGACAPGATRCSGDGVQSCSAAGQWGAPAACPSTAPSCSGAVCGQPPSCVGGAGGQADCGPGGNESCCTSPLVPGGTFSRSYDGVSAGYTDPQYRATVSDFRLDKYEITVGRFRQFVAAWDAGWRPAQGDGKHSHLNGGSGLTTGGGRGRQRVVREGLGVSVERQPCDNEGGLGFKPAERPDIQDLDAERRCKRPETDHRGDLVRGARVLCLGRWVPAERSGVELRRVRRKRATGVPVVGAFNFYRDRFELRELQRRCREAVLRRWRERVLFERFDQCRK